MNRSTVTALVLTLALYPAVRAAEFEFYLRGDVHDWWRFWGLAAAGHWLCFGAVWWALRREGRPWTSIGLDWSWFVRRRVWLFGAIGLLIAAALALSLTTSPEARDGLFPVQATNLQERLFMIFGAIVTAGVVEEVVFRGFAISRLGEWLGSPWFALPISVASFFFIHGTPSDPGRIVGISVVGLAFGVAYIRWRRLELLILIHGLLNLPLLFMPR